MFLAWISVCAVICFAFGLFTFWPLLNRSAKRRSASGHFHFYQGLIQEKERLMANLLDLENDRQTGKISSADFEPLRIDLLSEISMIESEINQFESKDPVLSKILQSLKELK